MSAIQAQAMTRAVLYGIAHLGLVPTGTLTAAAAAGAGTISVNTTQHIDNGSHLLWLDGTNEQTQLVAGLDTAANTLNLDMVAGHPLSQNHAIGAQYATNLTTTVPVKVETQLLISGMPVMAVVVVRWENPRAYSLTEWETVVNMTVGHILPLNRTQGVTLDEQIWAEDQSNRGQNAFDALTSWIAGNARLKDAQGNVTTMLLRSMRAVFRPNPVDYDCPVWESWLDLTLEGEPVTIVAP